MANSMTPDLIRLLQFPWRSSGIRSMKRYGQAFLKDCLRWAALFTEATRGLQTGNGSRSAQLRQKKDLRNRRRLAMTTRISRQYCGALDQELDQNRRSRPLPFLRQLTRQQRRHRSPRLRRLPLLQNKVARTTTMTKTGRSSAGETSLLQAQRMSLTAPQECPPELAWERQICLLQTLANKRLAGKSQPCR